MHFIVKRNQIYRLFFFFPSLSEMPSPMIPFHQRATSVPSKQLTSARWAVSLCLWRLLSNTSCCLWCACPVTSLCKSLSSLFKIMNPKPSRTYFPIQLPRACLRSTEELSTAQVVRTLLPLLLESSTESVAEISSTSLERILGPAESDAFLARIYERLVTGCYNIIANHSDPNR